MNLYLGVYFEIVYEVDVQNFKFLHQLYYFSRPSNITEIFSLWLLKILGNEFRHSFRYLNLILTKIQVYDLGLSPLPKNFSNLKEIISVMWENLTSSFAMEECALSCFPIKLSDFSKFLSSYTTCFYNTLKKS